MPPMNQFEPASAGERFELHLTLRKLMPENIADILMAYLPPVDWRDLPTRDELNSSLGQLQASFGRIERHLAEISRRLDRMS